MGNFGDTMKGIFYLVLIFIIFVLIAKFWGLRQFFVDVGRFFKAILDGIV